MFRRGRNGNTKALAVRDKSYKILCCIHHLYRHYKSQYIHSLNFILLNSIVKKTISERVKLNRRYLYEWSTVGYQPVSARLTMASQNFVAVAAIKRWAYFPG